MQFLKHEQEEESLNSYPSFAELTESIEEVLEFSEVVDAVRFAKRSFVVLFLQKFLSYITVKRLYPKISEKYSYKTGKIKKIQQKYIIVFATIKSDLEYILGLSIFKYESIAKSMLYPELMFIEIVTRTNKSVNETQRRKIIKYE